MDSINLDILKYALDNGMISLPDVQKQIEMKKREEILQQHPYDIWLGTDGKWYTYLPDDKKKRVLRKRSSEQDIQECIIEYYKKKEKPILVDDIFEEVLQKKVEYDEISNSTIVRYRNDYNRYFYEIKDTQINDLDEYAIEDAVRKAIAKYQLNTKALSNLRTIYYLIFKYARKKKLTQVNIVEIFSTIQIPKKFKRKNLDPELQVFSKKERDKIYDYLMDNLDIINLGIMLLFKSGIRVGELAALKREDLGENSIFISKTEVCYKIEGKYVYLVKETPKSEAGERNVIIPDNSQWLLKKLKSWPYIGEYLFEEAGERIKTFQFRNRLYLICKRLHIKKKSPHKVRKTYGTLLLNSHIDESTITSQMGHVDISCTKGHYYYDINDIEEKKSQINTVSNL